jgi:carbon monoxide dehydrogenase subunit G
MRVLKVIAIGIIAFSVLVFGIGAFLSKDFHVERSIEIDAPPEKVFAHVNSLKKWGAWSPWLARDPSIQNTYSGPDEGVGASVSWTSEGSGSGSQTIVASEPPSRIETQLDFGEMGQPTADWRFEPNGSGTTVTWGMTGSATGPLGGYFASMMDGMLGPDYEDGLARLKKVVESSAE